MTHQLEIEQTHHDGQPRIWAVAYYRTSAQDREESSIAIQQDQVREWASKNGVEIIHEFADAGRSGLNAEGRPAFTDMMDNWVKQRDDFAYVLCLDVSRWGRFQDIDLSAQYCAECRKHNKQIIYTTIGKLREDDPLYPVFVQFERFRAARCPCQYKMGDRIFRGCIETASRGYWAGGQPPYGLRRLLLDKSGEPVKTLALGQRKGRKNQRVTLVKGPPEEVSVIRRIFHEFVELSCSELQIAEGLNRDGIPFPRGNKWSASFVLRCLRNELYAGTMVYNRTSQRLNTTVRHNPPEQWVRTPDAFEGVISHEQYERAQQILEQRKRTHLLSRTRPN